jgi:hypothetical protein
MKREFELRGPEYRLARSIGDRLGLDVELKLISFLAGETTELGLREDEKTCVRDYATKLGVDLDNRP